VGYKKNTTFDIYNSTNISCT